MKTKANLYWPWGVLELKERNNNLSPSPIQLVDEITDLAIFIDYGWPEHEINSPEKLEELVKSLPHKYKVLVHLEPQPLMIDFYNWSKANEDLFDLIFVHYPHWHEYGTGNNPEKYRYYDSVGDTWIHKDNRKIWPKSKNITAIWSNKNWLAGHTIRHKLKTLLATIPGKVDFNNPVKKIDGLKDYRFEIVIDNEDSFITTEKFIDCVLTGTIPIIWSTKDHPQWKDYDTSGMIFFQTIEEAYAIINSSKLNKEYYDSCNKAIIHNFNQASKKLGLFNILHECGLSEIKANEI
tara:strand:- start:3268 stop:4146 length:879 start_codon:yes stop_codon:yes gene_type:complete